jgi:L-alanine-DL-glutamate epimerase-like enolase superfamily enzyme
LFERDVTEVLGMRLDAVELFALHIPFRMAVSHSAHKDRAGSDSVVLRLTSAGVHGYGEAVFREYVSGSLGEGRDLVAQAAEATRRLVGPLRDRETDWRDVAADGSDVSPSDLPLICALETALLDLDGRLSGKDAYQVLGLEPLRQTVAMSGVVPLLPPGAAADTLSRFAGLGASSFKIKLGPDPGANRAILAACRTAAGMHGDVRADANGVWRVADADAHFEACEAAGVTVVEQPFPAIAAGADEALRRGVGRGFLFIADEGCLSERDLEGIAQAGTYRLINFRLSKNGGLTRVLRLARNAERRGIGYQLGCMVGETAILSAIGRIAYSLLPSPRWFEGGYDRILYAEHLTDHAFGYWPDGTGPIVRGEGIGCAVREDRLLALSVGRERIL